jgi:hypothetical protein
MEQKWLFETAAGLTCMSLKAFIYIRKDCRPSKINKIALRASGNTQIPEGVYMIPMEWEKDQTSSSLQKPGTTTDFGY